MSESSNEVDTYHGYSIDREDQPQSTGDSMSDSRGLAEPLDEGYSPPEKWSPAQRSGHAGNTPWEEEQGEPLDERLRQEDPEPDPYVAAADAREDVAGEVGGSRSGRLIAADEGVREDHEAELYAHDVGIDGAAASAEEAAVHVIPEED